MKGTISSDPRNYVGLLKSNLRPTKIISKQQESVNNSDSPSNDVNNSNNKKINPLLIVGVIVLIFIITKK